VACGAFSLGLVRYRHTGHQCVASANTWQVYATVRIAAKPIIATSIFTGAEPVLELASIEGLAVVVAAAWTAGAVATAIKSSIDFPVTRAVLSESTSLT